MQIHFLIIYWKQFWRYFVEDCWSVCTCICDAFHFWHTYHFSIESKDFKEMFNEPAANVYMGNIFKCTRVLYY